MNSMDLVERALIRQEIAVAANPENYDSGNPTMDEGSYGCAENLLYILDNDIPTVDAEPVVHAQWEMVPERRLNTHGEIYRTGRKIPMCTHCRHASADFRAYFERCPDCGAKMDGGGQS